MNVNLVVTIISLNCQKLKVLTALYSGKFISVHVLKFISAPTGGVSTARPTSKCGGFVRCFPEAAASASSSTNSTTEPFGDKWHKFLCAGWMWFLSPNQHHDSTEGDSKDRQDHRLSSSVLLHCQTLETRCIGPFHWLSNSSNRLISITHFCFWHVITFVRSYKWPWMIL